MCRGYEGGGIGTVGTIDSVAACGLAPMPLGVAQTEKVQVRQAADLTRRQHRLHKFADPHSSLGSGTDSAEPEPLASSGFAGEVVAGGGAYGSSDSVV